MKFDTSVSIPFSAVDNVLGFTGLLGVHPSSGELVGVLSSGELVGVLNSSGVEMSSDYRWFDVSLDAVEVSVGVDADIVESSSSFASSLWSSSSWVCLVVVCFSWKRSSSSSSIISNRRL